MNKANIDQTSSELFSAEGAPSQPPPECIMTPGTLSAFHPRPMPSLRISCPASEGAAQRYREPLWRAFKAGP